MLVINGLTKASHLMHVYASKHGIKVYVVRGVWLVFFID